MKINIDDVKKAYLFLKRDAYYEKIDLFTRIELAKFDTSSKFNSELNKITNLISSLDIDSPYLEKIINSIGFNFLPKNIKKPKFEKEEAKEKNNKKNDEDDKEEINFITNQRSTDMYEIDEINYFFSANIPIFILSMLWVIKVGFLLDNELLKSCYGYRLDSKDGEFNSFNAFGYYLNQYNKWRNNAIDSGLHTLEDGHDVLLIALDFRQCFYHLKVKWGNIIRFIKLNVKNEDLELCLFLTEIIQKIHEKYFEVTRVYLSETHDILARQPIEVIPVGLPSSRILANWELRYFDIEVEQTLRPVYYGRYVDDILIVINDPDKDVVNHGSDAILEKYFQNTNILEQITGKGYKVCIEKNNKAIFETLFIKKSKIILHYYDHKHSWAGLKEFKEELKQKASEFRFLPEKEYYKDLVDEAYDIHYKGSINKLRSVIGITENSTKLSGYLFKQSLKSTLCNEGLRKQTVDELFRFYQGRNIFDYCRFWEQVFTILVVTKNYSELMKFCKKIESVRKKITFRMGNNSKNIIRKLKDDFEVYQYLSLSMALGYFGKSIRKSNVKTRFYNFLKRLNFFYEIKENGSLEFINESSPWILRRSNLLRHQYFCWPLLDFTDFEGSLCKLKLDDLSFKNNTLNLIPSKIEKTARFIHLDDHLLFTYLKMICETEPKEKYFDNPYLDFETAQKEEGTPETVLKILSNYISTEKPDPCVEADLGTRIIKINGSKREKSKKENNIRLGIVNLEVKEDDIEAAYHPRRLPNLTYERQVVLFDLLNIAAKEPRCDLVVFPEVCIPRAWLPFMVNYARRKDIGLIFGLEHIVNGSNASNYAATVLPFSSDNHYHNALISLRLKNHYSPEEKRNLENHRLSRPSYGYMYHLFKWRGLVFTVYNCFELTDISHRCLFRSDIDLLVAIEYNPDINYFSNIIESTARDIHCYATQSNSSNFGDSRLISPSKTEKMNIIRVKGGENAVMLKAQINIDELRNFQVKEYDPTDKRFKPTPAGFDHEAVLDR